MRALRTIGLLYRYEVRSALRDRSVVVHSILIPILLYPGLLWAMFTVMALARGEARRQPPRVVLVDLPPWHASLAESLRSQELTLVDPTDTATAFALLRSGRVDAVVEFAQASEGDRAGHPLTVRVSATGARERSASAAARVRRGVRAYSDALRTDVARREGIPPQEWRLFEVRTSDRASGRERGAFLLGLVVPVMFLIMTAVGCFSPAVDSTAGERERSTWETTMSLATARWHVVAAKYLSVTTFGTMAGLLNLWAMTLSMGAILRPMLERHGAGLRFTIPAASLPLLALSGLLLAAIISAAMMLLASFARSYKEGQAMIMPFYLMLVVPSALLQRPGLSLSTPLALVPVANLVVMVREAMAGVFHWPQIGLTLGVSVAAVVCLVLLATFVLNFEDVVIGSYQGTLTTLVARRLVPAGRHRRRGAP